jgi:hypothetical protein
MSVPYAGFQLRAVERHQRGDVVPGVGRQSENPLCKK